MRLKRSEICTRVRLSLARALLSSSGPATSLGRRLAIIRRIRAAIASSGLALCELFPPELGREPAESLTAEIIPLAEACRFLEREARAILAPRRPSHGSRPFWLNKVELSIRREPLGVVLIIGPANYPLFLPGVQALQALVAGNAVVLKPGKGGSKLANALLGIAVKSGLPQDLWQVLDESVSSAEVTIRERVDKVVLTGSVESGRAVYKLAAEHMTPVILELSGFDPVFVLPGANLARAAAAISFGRKLNKSFTCIAPRRVFAFAQIADELEHLLSERLQMNDFDFDLVRVTGRNDALSLAAQSSYALGATIFGEPSAAKELAASVSAGVVVVNDMIVPTADPRVPFGGRRSSGFGSTRGAEGLLEFTAVKAVIVQRARRLRHLEPHPANAAEFFSAYLEATHSSAWGRRFAAWRKFAGSIMKTQRGKAS